MMKKTKKTPWAVFIAIILAMIVGSATGPDFKLFGIHFYSLFDILGKLFINALTLVVVPLVAASIITGIAKIGKEHSFGRLGAKTFGFYFATSLLAILIGLFFVNLLKPGLVGGMPLEGAGAATAQNTHLQAHISGEKGVKIVDILMQIVPSNAFLAFSQGQMLGIIFFSLLFGYAMSKIESRVSEILMGFWQGVFETMIQMTHLILKCLPIGVFCLVAKVFATIGIESLKPLALFSTAVIGGLAVFTFVALPLLLKFIGRVSPKRHFRAMGPALITAFSTSSSSATLPVTMDCVEKRAGVSNKICSLVVPLGTSINMSGSALYECVAAMFVAQAYGIDLSFTTQFLVVLLALITSMGVAGVPSGSLVAVIVILKAIGLPAEGVGLFLAVDRILDMCRTTVNVFSDSCCAILVARTEGEKKVLSRDDLNYS
jgi:proton glutamate symport protein